MKDEEMADKHAEEYRKTFRYYRAWHGQVVDKSPSTIVEQSFKDGFLAGLKAGRPQWHKVADGDLPTTVGRRFLVSNRYCTMIGYWNGKTFVSADEDTAEIASPIAWCEIPTFDKE